MNIYGASGHAKVIIDIIKSKAIEVDYVLDDDPDVKEIAGYKVDHKIEPEMLKNLTILAIGNNLIRQKLARKFQGEFHPAVAHNSSVVSNSAQLGHGTVVMANASINAAVNIGAHCIINTAAVVEHDVVLEDFVHISPGAILTGDVRVKEGTQIGAGAIVIPGVEIGKWAIVGAGAVIIEDVPDFAIVVGNPGRTVKSKKNKNEKR